MMPVKKISFGRERRRVMDDEDRKIIAYHEAGHAIVQAKIDDGLLPIHKVTIIPWTEPWQYHVYAQKGYLKSQ